MTFIEALAAYHAGKRIRRKYWRESDYLSKERIVLYCGCQCGDCESPEYKGICPEWQDILADDWEVVEK